MYDRVELRDLGDLVEARSSRGPQRSTTLDDILKELPDADNQGSRYHASALLTLLFFGLLPLVIYFGIVKEPFKAKTEQCGSTAERYDSAIEGVFTIDRISGNFPFWLAKLLDTTWDLFVGRGMQFLAGLVSYVVLSNALLRALEESPIPYRTFTSLTINGASASTIIYILKDLHRYGRRRTIWLFTYSTVSLAYVLAMPTLFSIMTGYVPITSSFIQMTENSQLIPWEKFTDGYASHELPGVKDGTCLPENQMHDLEIKTKSRSLTCNSSCVTHFWNKTDMNLATGEITDSLDYFTLVDLDKSSHCYYLRNEKYDGISSSLREMASNWQYNDKSKKYKCSDPVYVTIDGKDFTYPDVYGHVNTTGAHCFNGTAYGNDTISSHSRCLPKTTRLGGLVGYQWGFSAMLTSVLLVVHAVWAISLYAVWLDAELCSSLVKQGFRLTQLRGVYFAVAATAAAGATKRSMPPPPLSTMESGLCDEGEGKKEEQQMIGRVRAADVAAMMEREEAVVRFELLEEELPFAEVVAYDGA